MSNLRDQLREDRALRDAARRNVLADIELVRENLSGAKIASRMVGRVGDGAFDVLERAKAQAEDKRGVLAALIGALMVWIAREPLLELLGLAGEDDAGDEAEANETDLPPGDDDND